MKSLTHQSGMSLVELMVAVSLSLILMAGVIHIHLSSKSSFQVQQELSGLQQNQRLAVELLSRDIRKAGLSINLAVPSAFDTSNINHWDGDESGEVPASDEITITYESAKDCIGDNTNNFGGIAVNRYFIQNGILKCEGVNHRAWDLVSGVVNMQILYGEDTDAIVPGAVRTANRYVKPTVANMDNVVSVRIALLLDTAGAVRNLEVGQSLSDGVQRDFFLLDAPTISFTDGKRREAITTTITLRNVS